MIQPTLLGTWEKVHSGRDDEGVVDAKETNSLTFTETHFFEQIHEQDVDGRTRNRYDRAGTVSHTDTTVTKSFFDDDRSVSVDKDYYLAADGNVLLIHTWGDDEPAEGFDQFTRVAAAPMTAGQLRGTWQRHAAWNDDDEGWVEGIETITFTGTRFIAHGVRFNTDNDETLETWSWQGGWIDNGTSITRIQAGHVDVDKQYVLAGDLLAINPWGDNEPRENLEVFTRVQDPIPGGIEGVWTGVGDSSNWTIVLTPTQFTITTTRGPEESDFTLSGTYQVNREELFIMVTVEDALTDGESILGTDENWWKGQVSRWAFAPTNSPTRMVVSPHWHEQILQDQEYVKHPDRPYGNYWLTVEKE